VKRVVIAGGGTGGHVYPGLAVAQVLRQRHRDLEITFMGTERGLEAQVVPKEGYDLKLLPVRGLPRQFSRAQISALIAFLKSVFITWRFLLRWRPEVILGTGGYVSAPAIVAGRALRIPIVLQEQNAVPGAVNRMLSRLATEVHLNFAGARRHFRRRDHLRLTGNPLRPGLLTGNRARAFRHFRLRPDRRTIFSLGGSHGAHSINEALVDAIRRVPRSANIQFLIQTGKADLAWMQDRLSDAPVPVSCHAYLNNVDDAYTIADLVICRAGAMSLSEITASGIPAILVPYPHATDDHQVQNASELVDLGAAVMILDSDLSGERLVKEIQTLITDPARLRRMASSAHGSAKFGGAEKLADAMTALATEAEDERGHHREMDEQDLAELTHAAERAVRERRSESETSDRQQPQRGQRPRGRRGQGGRRGDRRPPGGARKRR